MPIQTVPKAEPVVLGPFTFHLNPNDFTAKTRAVENVVRTKSGFVRQHWGQDPDTYILRGTTGKAGLEEIQQIRALEGMSNISFIFPYKGIRTTVRVVEVSYTNVAAQSPYIHNYNITLIQDLPKMGSPLLSISGLPTGLGGEEIAREGDNIFQLASRLPEGWGIDDLQRAWDTIKALNPGMKDWSNIPEGTHINVEGGGGGGGGGGGAG